MATKKNPIKPASERIKKFVAESSIPGSDANELDEVEAKLGAEEQQRMLLTLRLDAVEGRIEKLKARQVELCPHHNTKQDSSYFSGSYDEVARTFYTLKCERCGKTLKSWDKAHSWYG